MQKLIPHKIYTLEELLPLCVRDTPAFMVHVEGLNDMQNMQVGYDSLDDMVKLDLFAKSKWRYIMESEWTPLFFFAGDNVGELIDVDLTKSYTIGDEERVLVSPKGFPY